MSRRHAYLPTALGELLAIAEVLADPALTAPADALVGLYFPDHWYPPSPESLGTRVEHRDDPVFSPTRTQLTAYLAGHRKTFDLPLRTTGDPTSAAVWELLAELPYGATTTYGAIADRLGNRHLAQRVGQAVGHNPISIIIACHRVLGADGSLTGYAGGLERKRRLLDLEAGPAQEAGRLF